MLVNARTMEQPHQGLLSARLNNELQYREFYLCYTTQLLLGKCMMYESLIRNYETTLTESPNGTSLCFKLINSRLLTMVFHVNTISSVAERNRICNTSLNVLVCKSNMKN